MKRGPQAGLNSAKDFMAVASASWSPLPDWVEQLATYASETSGRRAAERIGYSAAVVTHVLRNSYTGDLKRVEEKVRGALMGATVDCEVYGEIGRDRCLDNQKLPFAATSSLRVKCFRACRSGCPHSRLTREAS